LHLPGFNRSAEKALSEMELQAALAAVARNPEQGDLIEGTGGIRKLRVAGSGRGKSGGARLIYFYFGQDAPI